MRTGAELLSNTIETIDKLNANYAQTKEENQLSTESEYMLLHEPIIIAQALYKDFMSKGRLRHSDIEAMADALSGMVVAEMGRDGWGFC